jgi:hypothetical protein
MNLLAGLNWLTSMATRRTAQAVDTHDPGDMGTAFGLDASIETSPELELPKAKSSASGASASWNKRLVRRPRR